jgi:hypothetical protein
MQDRLSEAERENNSIFSQNSLTVEGDPEKQRKK